MALIVDAKYVLRNRYAPRRGFAFHVVYFKSNFWGGVVVYFSLYLCLMTAMRLSASHLYFSPNLT